MAQPEFLVPIVISEKGGLNRIVTLQSTDLPRGGQWLGLGGEQRGRSHWLPGSPRPTVHILGPQERDISFRGMFEDRRRGIEGHAVAIAFLLDSIRKAGHLATIHYGTFHRTVRWKRAEFDPVEFQRINYQLEFEVVSSGLPGTTRVVSALSRIPVLGPILDRADTLKGILSSIPRGVGSETLDDILNDVDEISSVLTTADGILGQLGGGSVNDVDAKQAANLLDTAQEKSFDSLMSIDQLNWTALASDAFSKTAAAVSVLGARSEAVGLASDVRVARVPVAGLAREVENATVYVTLEGDTLQRLARRFYGSATRWTEIQQANGLADTVVDPGTQLIIPNPNKPDFEVQV